MKSTIEKALEANRTAGSAERIEVDGFVFSRFPMEQPVMCITDVIDGSTEELGVSMRSAEIVREYLAQNAPSLTWTEIAKQFSASDPIHSNVHGQIWKKFGAHLDIFYEHDYNGNPKKVWYLSEDDVTAIFPDDATHLIIARYFPSREDVTYLKKHGYKRSSCCNAPDLGYTYFLDTEWDAKTMKGMLYLGPEEEY